MIHAQALFKIAFVFVFRKMQGLAQMKLAPFIQQYYVSVNVRSYSLLHNIMVHVVLYLNTFNN